MIKIKVPATSANLGAGFDCMGLAVDIFNEVTVEQNKTGLIIETDPDLPADKNNLVYRALAVSLRYIKKTAVNNEAGSEFFRSYLKDPGIARFLTIKQKNAVPKASGLGSSAACITAGALAADALCGNLLTSRQLTDLTASLDGHPDNVVPALLGGITAAYNRGGVTEYMNLPPPGNISVVFFIPGFPLSTHAARAALPAAYTRADAVYNIGHAVLTFAALTRGDIDLLRRVTGDKIHEPYREKFIPNFKKITDYAKGLGGACYLSGAGPAIAAFTDGGFDKRSMENFLSTLPDGWKLTEAKILERGAITYND